MLPSMHGEARQNLGLRGLCGVVALVCGCSSDPERAPALSTFVATDAGADAAASGEDSSVAPLADAGALAWEIVTDLDFDDAAASYALIHEGVLLMLVGRRDLYRLDLASPALEARELSGWPDGYFEKCASCAFGARMYFLGGGGNGVFSPNFDYHWEVVDLAAGAWLTGGVQDLPYHYPGGASGEGRCFVIGGNNGGSKLVNAVQEFLPDSGTFDYHAPLPMNLSSPAGIVASGAVIVAGGGRATEPGDTEFTYRGVAVADVFLLDLANDSEWSSGPDLPWPLLDGTLVEARDRIYHLGGVTNGDVHLRPEVLSWAMGEPAWRVDGLLPGNASSAVFMSDGTSIWAIVRAQSDTEYVSRLYRWTP